MGTYGNDSGGIGTADKDTEGKLPYELVPVDAMEEVVKVYQFGSGKYQPRQWEKGMPWLKCYGAMQRHLVEWRKGVDVDSESGCHHLAHVVWHCLALIRYSKVSEMVGLDDRGVEVTSSTPVDSTPNEAHLLRGYVSRNKLSLQKLGWLMGISWQDARSILLGSMEVTDEIKAKIMEVVNGVVKVDEDLERLRDFYIFHESYQRVGEVLGVSKSSVHRMVNGDTPLSDRVRKRVREITEGFNLTKRSV